MSCDERGKDAMPLKAGWLTGGFEVYWGWYIGCFIKKRLRTSFVVCLTVFRHAVVGDCRALDILILFV